VESGHRVDSTDARNEKRLCLLSDYHSFYASKKSGAATDSNHYPV